VQIGRAVRKQGRYLLGLREAFHIIRAYKSGCAFKGSRVEDLNRVLNRPTESVSAFHNCRSLAFNQKCWIQNIKRKTQDVFKLNSNQKY